MYTGSQSFFVLISFQLNHNHPLLYMHYISQKALGNPTSKHVKVNLKTFPLNKTDD